MPRNKPKKKPVASAPRLGTFERALEKAEKQLGAAEDEQSRCRGRLLELSFAVPRLQETVTALQSLLGVPPEPDPNTMSNVNPSGPILARNRVPVPAFVPEHLHKFIEPIMGAAVEPGIPHPDDEFLKDDLTTRGTDLLP